MGHGPGFPSSENPGGSTRRIENRTRILYKIRDGNQVSQTEQPTVKPRVPIASLSGLPKAERRMANITFPGFETEREQEVPYA
jgi:hypothetical protein